MQLQMFDPREYPKRTFEMLNDLGLGRAIDAMRPRRRIGAALPYVERLCDVDGRPAWAVDDGGRRFVVVNVVVYRLSDLGFAEASIREAARAAFDRLDAGVSS
ncbi:hypothetical protein [Bradyrhizobium diazoefficiens]|uniref:hypothetical protein n=1 Tax=Bradyrhizobium diazoefficiens TaxID=1355477 RepID=UPI0004B545B1|nr:hypothetical protein [Bradyrhizobium diazoefficiens]